MPRLAGCATTRWTAERRSLPAGSGITIIDTHGNPLANNRLTIRESTRGRYGLKLNTRPTHTVRVTAIASDGDPDLQVLPTANAEKAITPDEWETPFYLELRAAIDDDEETGERGVHPLVVGGRIHGPDHHRNSECSAQFVGPVDARSMSLPQCMECVAGQPPLACRLFVREVLSVEFGLDEALQPVGR